MSVAARKRWTTRERNQFSKTMGGAGALRKGMRFGLWVVAKDRGSLAVEVVCDPGHCGTNGTTTRENLTTGKTRSCGCVTAALIREKVGWGSLWAMEFGAHVPDLTPRQRRLLGLEPEQNASPRRLGRFSPNGQF
jgi:hypothetical protein